ncbi:MAG: putative lipid II flippase FtsW [Hyphomicrobiales bacterium]|nr:putative lipid II flippase FtsW [Hyphomicrobiales bacterium]
MISRTDRSLASEWWWTVDRGLVGAVLLLMVTGLVVSLAASPPVAARLHLSTFHFVHRQALYLVPAAIALIATSTLDMRQTRRAALGLYVVSLLLIVLALKFGVEVKGSRRWIFGVQPSEFLKPAFVVLVAWAFSEGGKGRDRPGAWIAFALLPVTIVPLLMQPDFGQTMLLSIVWAALFFMAGLHWLWVAGIGGVGGVGVMAAYKLSPHVHERISQFLGGGAATANGGAASFQVDTALASFVSGGLFGRGPGEGIVKRSLPDSHTDFAFAVVGEEFGVVACMAIAAVFAFVVVRGLFLASRDDDPFARFAAAGLLTLFGLQSVINMAVDVHLMPAKGMTLPFISYGGSSLISLAIEMGFLIAVTRRRPRASLSSVGEAPFAAAPAE